MLYTDCSQVNKIRAEAGKLITQIINSSSLNRDAVPWRISIGQYWLTRSHPAPPPQATHVAEVFQRIKPYLIFSYFLIRYNLVTGTPKLSRSQHGPQENKTLQQAPKDTEMRLQGSEDTTPVRRDPTGFRKMTGAFGNTFKLQHAKTERL